MHNYNGEYPWYKDADEYDYRHQGSPNAEWDEDASHGPYALPNDIPPEQTVRVVNRHPDNDVVYDIGAERQRMKTQDDWIE